MNYQHFRDLARIYPLFTASNVVANEQAERCVNTHSALTETHLSKEVRMAPKAHNAPIDSAQYQDPLIVNARLVNFAAEFERNLAARKALRPIRSEAARKGWRSRNGL